MNRNVVLVILDTVRKDYFDSYAPRLTERSDVSFHNCRATSSWSVPSHASIFTGQLPHQHHVHAESFGPDLNFDDAIGELSVTNSLPDHRSIGISSNIYINDMFGFDGLFDEFHNHTIGTHRASVLFPSAFSNYRLAWEIENRWMRYGYLLKEALTHEQPVKSLANGVWTLIGFTDQLEKLPFKKLTDDGATVNATCAVDRARNGSEPFFMFVNYMDAHTPHQNTRGYDQTLHSVSNTWSSSRYGREELLSTQPKDDRFVRNYRELYGTAIDYLDRVVASMIDDLMQVTAGETTIVITSDHGHNLGYESEEYQFRHVASASEGVMHVPLEIVNPPSGAPETVDRLFSQTDLYELLEALADDRWPADLGDDWIAAESVGILGFERDSDMPEEWNRMIRCAYNDDTKYEWDSIGRRRRYTLPTDADNAQHLVEENCDIPDEALALFDGPLESYKSRWEGTSSDESFAQETEQRLKQLGYL